jgi:hypothetical protein
MTTTFKIGMSDNKYITFNFKTIGHLKRIIKSTLPKAILIKKNLRKINFRDSAPKGYISLTNYLSREITPKAIKH